MRSQEKNKKARYWTLSLGLALFFLSCSPQNIFRNIAEEGGEQSAYAIWSELQEGAVSLNAKAIFVDSDLTVNGFNAGVTWGAEKEASSGLITRVMTPTDRGLKNWLRRLTEEDRKIFLKDFLSHYIKNKNSYRIYRTEEGLPVDLARDVKDAEGNTKLIDLDRLRSINYNTASLEVLESKFDEFLEMTDGKPLSFIRPSTRMKLYKGELPGLRPESSLNPKKNRLDAPGFSSWEVNFGQAEKYILDAHGQSKGWEINFKALPTYGEFEEMVMWFRTELKNAGKLFQAPGHQRIVFRIHPDLKKKHLAELYRVLQALIVVDGIKGKTGIEKASHKSVQSDTQIAGLDTGRGVLRLESNRWGRNHYGVEFRAGTKDIRTARFTQTTLAARVATNDWSGLAKINDYSLMDWSNNGPAWTAEELANRFSVSQASAKKALKRLKNARVKSSYTIPFWKWDDPNIPFLSATKQKFIKSLTKDFIIQLANLAEDDNTTHSVLQLMRTWTKSSNLSEELREYIKPKRMPSQTTDLIHFIPQTTGRPTVSSIIDVNNIDLGIEYSGKFPVRLQAQYTPDKLVDNKKAWIQTFVDLNLKERKAVIKNVAKELLQELGGEGEPVEIENPGGHGHGLEISYEIRDPQNRRWAVEWDGIGRSYDPEGAMLEDSVRGGSIELITPKFTPQPQEMEAVFRAFEKNNILPTIRSGGGHINIDLAAFENKPKQLARFLSIFHEYRGIISLMFQYVGRLPTAEPLDISPSLSRALINFNGTEEELKKLLYNKRYFNTRYGRKTHYAQLNLLAFFQDVIPEEFVTDDFDIKSPTEPWRRAFRAEPHIRKAEFRLFNAPRDAMESALQIRLVRAMLSKALNENGALNGKVQKVDHEAYLKNPSKAFRDLQKLCDDLGLDINDFRPAVAEGLSDTDLALRSLFFEPLKQKLALHPKQPAWGRAVNARSAEESLSSKGRQWSPGAADRQNTMTHEQRVQAAREAQRRRRQITPNRQLPGQFKRTDSCVDAVGAFL